MAESTHPSSQTLRQHPHARPLKLGAALKNVLVMLLGFGAALIALEVVFVTVDPNGTGAHTRFVRWLNEARLPDETGYTFPEGTHSLGRYTFTFQNGTRLVPDTNTDAPRTLVLIGDSVTFGMGVADAETFANQLARALPAWNVINAGLPGYNISNLERMAERYAGADCRLYIATHNDPEAGVWSPASPQPWQPQLRYELQYYLKIQHSPAPVVDEAAYMTRVAAMNASGVHTATFDDTAIGQRMIDTGVAHGIARGGGVVSAHDPHPDAQAHALIAAALVPIVHEHCR